MLFCCRAVAVVGLLWCVSLVRCSGEADIMCIHRHPLRPRVVSLRTIGCGCVQLNVEDCVTYVTKFLV